MSVENSDLNDTAALPNSLEMISGATAGSMGDCSRADLMTGFFDTDKDINKPNTDGLLPYPVENTPWAPDAGGGFVGRPNGYER